MIDDAFQHLLDTYLSTRHRKKVDIITKAFNFARQAHKGVRRLSGEPYILHPISVAQIACEEMGLGSTSICSALLHDVVVDTDYTVEDIENIFGSKIAQIVDGLTKISGGIFGEQASAQAENFKKLLLTMSNDIRVILIKICDRLHNMRTLESQPANKQYKIAGETLYIYAPLANRLGLNKIKTELEDLSFKYEHPEEYASIEEKLASTQASRDTLFKQFTTPIREALDKMGINYQIKARVKSPYSIWNKMQNKHVTFEEIYDILAVRIIYTPKTRAEEINECFRIYVAISQIYKSHPDRLRDWVNHPKANGYQALHVTLMSKQGQWIEVQIRSDKMDEIAEQGFAAHWKYKERGSGDTTVRDEEAKLSWLRQILEWQKDVSDNKEFISMVKNDLDLFSDNVYCFTPQGDVKNLPAGSTPIDFAYSIHSAVGNRMKQAAVNGKMVPLDYKIQNGDRIEIFTSQNVKGPSRDWLNIAKSTQAKNKINQWFKQEGRAGNITRGKELVASCAKGKGFEISDLTKPEFTKKVVTKYGFRDWDSILAAVGHGGLKEGQIVNKLIDLYQESKKKAPTDEQVLASVIENNKNKPVKIRSTNGVLVNGVVDVNVRFSRCCSPVPGDEIVGFITRGRGISIHRTDCVNVIALPESEKSRLVDVEWQQESFHSNEKFMAEIKIFCNNRIGIFADISKIFTEREIDIASMSSKTSKQGTATINMSFEVGGVDALQQLINRLMAVNSVIDIERSNG